MTAIIDAPASVIDVARDHANKHVDREVGGILLGTLDGDTASVQVALPALQAVGHRAQVTFTHEVWEDILTTVDREYPDLRIVGWYHSHPGFGIFLSEYDKFIHRSFFADPKMLALVVDPHSGEHGWFGWVAEDVELLLKEFGKPAHSTPAQAAPSRAVDPRPRRAVSILAALGLVTAGFVGGYSTGLFTDEPQQLAPATAVSDEQWTRAQDEIVSLEAALAQAEADAAQQSTPRSQPPANVVERPPLPAHVTYRVRRGDNLWVLAESFYGDGRRYRRLVRANPGTSANAIDTGQLLRVPIPQDGAGRDN